MDDDDLATLKALEGLPRRPLTPTERTHKHRRQWGPEGKRGFARGNRQGGQESFIDLFNRLSAQFGTDVTDDLIEGGFTPFAFIGAVTHIFDDLDLWFEATGERVSGGYLRSAERLALECWLWETHDRSGRMWGQRGKDGARNPDRWGANKSPDHDIPWPDAPVNWAPRRWFPGRGIFPGKGAWEMSIRRALKAERALTRAQLATEASSGEWNDGDGSGWWEDTSVSLISERNHPKPQGFWSVKKDGLTGRLIWKDRKWEPCNDEPPPESVLRRTHEPPKEPEPLVTPRPSGYWRHVKGRPIMHGIEIVISPMQKALVSLRRSLDFDHDDLDRLARSAAIEAA